jgi:hypothetical protein
VAGLLIVAFDASVTRLIQLYILGVFTSFTFSQAGMVRPPYGTEPFGTTQSASCPVTAAICSKSAS